jgi:methionyl-tRNA formyltransferase
LQIDWTRPPVEIDRLVRLGGAWTLLGGKRLRIVAAELADVTTFPSDELRGDRVGGLRLVTVQPEGKAPMPFDAFGRGARLAEVEHLGR